MQAESVIRSVPYPHSLPPQPLAPSGGSDAEHHVELLTQLSTLDRLQFETAQARPTQLPASRLLVNALTPLSVTHKPALHRHT